MDYKFIQEKKAIDCCGCEACSYICPKHIIKMQEDDEGFIYPKVINADDCISCGKCEKICPISNPIKADDTINAFCSGYLKNDNDIKKSASGGLATAISRCFINEYEGIVYGVKYSEDYKSIHYCRATTLDELESFRGSKYAQSHKIMENIAFDYSYIGGNVFNSVLLDLKEGRKVLFIGLPCEVAAIIKITQHKYNNLYTMELVCHGPTSQKVHREFLSNLGNNINYFSVRYKYTGWKPYYIKACFENTKYHLSIFHESDYGVAFRYLKRPSCGHCNFKLGNIVSGLHADITVGDFHYIEPSCSAWNKWGSSVGYIHSVKGVELIKLSQDNFNFFNTNPSSALKSSVALAHRIKSKLNRKEYSRVFCNKGLKQACKLKSVILLDHLVLIKGKILKSLVSIRNLIFKLMKK